MMIYTDKPYTRLIHVAICVLDDDRVLTNAEKEAFAIAICDTVSPYDACYTMGNPNDQWESIYYSYREMDEIGVVEEWLHVLGFDTLEDYVINEGLPIPDIDDMTERITESIDLEEYINDYYDDYLDIFFEQLIHNYTDEEIVTYFADNVKPEVYEDD